MLMETQNTPLTKGAKPNAPAVSAAARTLRARETSAKNAARTGIWNHPPYGFGAKHKVCNPPNANENRISAAGGAARARHLGRSGSARALRARPSHVSSDAVR